MLQHINRTWSITRRLTVIALAGLLPVAPLTYEIAADKLEQIAYTQKELRGLEQQHLVWNAIIATDEIERAKLMKTLADARGALTAEGFSARQDVDEVLLTTTPTDRVRTSAQLLNKIADGSGLLLDPEHASYHLMNALTTQMPAAMEELAQLTNVLTESTTQAVIDPAVAAAISVLTKDIADLQTTFTLLASSPEGKSIIPRVSSSLAEVAAVQSWLASKNGQAFSLDSQAVRQNLAPLKPAIERLWQQADTELHTLLDARIAREWRKLVVDAIITLALAVIAFGLAILMARALAGGIRQQIHALNRISNADGDVEIACRDCSNENGEIAAALEKLLAGVQERQRLARETERQAKEASDLNERYAREHERFMHKFRETSARIASGDYGHRMSKDVIAEYHEIVEELNRMAARLEANQKSSDASTQARSEAIAAIGAALARLADGDLGSRLDDAIAPEFDKIKTDFNSAVSQLESTIMDVKSGAEGIRIGTDEISQASDDLSRRTETQAANLEQTAAAVAEITSTVARTSENASQANQVVTEAKQDAERSGAIVARAIEAMSAIERSSQQISQIIGVIDEIAFQTNLLALNAGVEAARAGDAGRGFAVVASEVRALAQRSAEAAKEIKGLISTSTTQVNQGVDLVGETGRALQRIVARVSEIDSAVAVIAASAKEQALGLNQVNTAVSQMDQVTQQNAAMVEEATAATRTLQQQTEELNGLVGRFHTSAGVTALRDAGRRMAAAGERHGARKSLAKGHGGIEQSSGAPAARARASGDWEEF